MWARTDELSSDGGRTMTCRATSWVDPSFFIDAILIISSNGTRSGWRRRGFLADADRNEEVFSAQPTICDTPIKTMKKGAVIGGFRKDSTDRIHENSSF